MPSINETREWHYGLVNCSCGNEYAVVSADLGRVVAECDRCGMPHDTFVDEYMATASLAELTKKLED